MPECTPPSVGAWGTFVWWRGLSSIHTAVRASGLPSHLMFFVEGTALERYAAFERVMDGPLPGDGPTRLYILIRECGTAIAMCQNRQGSFPHRDVHTHIPIWHHCGEPLTSGAVTNSALVLSAAGSALQAVRDAAVALERAAGTPGRRMCPESRATKKQNGSMS